MDVGNGYNYVGSFESMTELETFIKTVNVGVKDRSTFKSGLRIRYRCKERRKFPECGIQFAAKVDANTSLITLFRKGDHNHDIRFQTTRPSSPVRERVKMYLSLGLTAKQVKRALETQGVDLPSPRKFRSLVAYYTSNRSPACKSAFITKRSDSAGRKHGDQQLCRSDQLKCSMEDISPEQFSSSTMVDDSTPISFVMSRPPVLFSQTASGDLNHATV